MDHPKVGYNIRPNYMERLDRKTSSKSIKNPDNPHMMVYERAALFLEGLQAGRNSCSCTKVPHNNPRGFYKYEEEIDKDYWDQNFSKGDPCCVPRQHMTPNNCCDCNYQKKPDNLNYQKYINEPDFCPKTRDERYMLLDKDSLMNKDFKDDEESLSKKIESLIELNKESREAPMTKHEVYLIVYISLILILITRKVTRFVETPLKYCKTKLEETINDCWFKLSSSSLPKEKIGHKLFFVWLICSLTVVELLYFLTWTFWTALKVLSFPVSNSLAKKINFFYL